MGRDHDWEATIYTKHLLCASAGPSPRTEDQLASRLHCRKSTAVARKKVSRRPLAWGWRHLGTIAMAFFTHPGRVKPRPSDLATRALFFKASCGHNATTTNYPSSLDYRRPYSFQWLKTTRPTDLGFRKVPFAPLGQLAIDIQRPHN